jgi:hypothetical protein
MSTDSAIRDHQSWLGYLQPEGLVVSPAALVDAQVILASNIAAKQHRLLGLVQELPLGEETVPAITSLRGLLTELLEWPEERLAGSSAANPIPEFLKIPLRDFGETLEPTLAFQDLAPTDQDRPWILLVQEVAPGTPLDAPIESALSGWSASPTRRFERLLRESGVPIGLLSNGTHLQLIYAPRGENAGSLTFPVGAMSEVSGRPILSAFWMLLSKYRLLSAPSAARLPALLKRSRDYQSRVSTALANQVLEALYELLRGFQSANDHTSGELLRDYLENDPNQIYGGLLSVLMRLVFLLYAEDQGLMPDTDLFTRNYSLHGLFERLRTDAEQYPDTMEDRYGAWPQFLALFRVVYHGCRHPLIRMPARAGHLFDPERYPFLEGRPRSGAVSTETTPTAISLPLVPDGVIYRVLEKLLVLDGERLSYKTLDVEQIGSVYETMMGFRLEQARGITIALKPAKAHGAPVPINLEEVIAKPGKDRKKLIREKSDYELTASIDNAVKAAGSIDELLAALERRIARSATPQPVAAGTMILVPTDERRRSGSHYTPRSLTEPIVRTTLEPIFRQLGENPTPDQILNLKICDPAMGSGAFLVEACRQLAESLVRSWAANGYKPYIPPDEDELLHARRLVAQRCLYGVDRNPMAVDLAKLSLWLVTLAKDHPFTFLDHSLRCGDSLVGLTRRQIIGFHWEPSRQRDFQGKQIEERIQRATSHRIAILNGGDDMLPGMKLVKLQNADIELNVARLMGDACVSAFFGGTKAAERNASVDKLFGSLSAWADSHFHPDHRRAIAEAAYEIRTGIHPILPFHWELEFPEVFRRDQSGFDAFVGNPPFAGKNTLISGNRAGYLDWLKMLHEESHGNADIVAHFFRRTFNLLRGRGCFGLIATNTIGQGDTRFSSLRWICNNHGTIYNGRKRVKWPGQAAVVVSVVHVCRGDLAGPFELDCRTVPIITAYLFHAGGNEDPSPLIQNAGRAFIGAYVLGMGFTFDDTDNSGTASTLADMRTLVDRNAKNAEVIFPYIGGDEVNGNPTHAHHRYVINFRDWPRQRQDLGQTWTGATELQRQQWLSEFVVPHDYPGPVAGDFPDILTIVEQRVKPSRETQGSIVNPKRWWMFARPASDLQNTIQSHHLDRVLAIARVSQYHQPAFLASNMIFSEQLVVLAVSGFAWFGLIQSQIHELWFRIFGSTQEERPRYTPSDCFETFPFPTILLESQICGTPSTDQTTFAALESAGREYYEFRSSLLVKHNEGLTKTYNRFHDKYHDTSEVDARKVASIQRLRELHAVLDRAVLAAYGWGDVAQAAISEYLIDHEDEDSEEAQHSRRKKPWRYRWPDEFRDEVLARLLALNAQRAAEERLAGVATAPAKKKVVKRTTPDTTAPPPPNKAQKKRPTGDREMF